MALVLLFPIQSLAADAGWTAPNLRDHPLVGVIVDAHGQRAPESALLSALRSTRFAFVGEKHANAGHHRLEGRLVAHRPASLPGSAVVFEMLDDAQRPSLASVTADDSLDVIRTKLVWPAKGWDFKVYGPLFQSSLKGGQLVAGNIGKDSSGACISKAPAFSRAMPAFRRSPAPARKPASTCSSASSKHTAACRSADRWRPCSPSSWPRTPAWPAPWPRGSPRC